MAGAWMGDTAGFRTAGPTMARINLHSMQLLSAIAVAGSLTKAAGELHMTASAVSKRIAELEARIGTPLLTRTSTGVALTPAGEIVVRHTDDILLRVARMTQEVGELLARQQGEITVMANTTAILLGLFDDVEAFRRTCGGVRIQVREGSSLEVAEAVKSGHVDVGVAVRHARMGGLQLHPYRPTSLVVVMPEGHALQGLGPLQMAQLHEHALIWAPPADLIDGLQPQEAVLRQARHRVRSFNGVLHSVRQEGGIAVLPAVAVPDPLPPGLVTAPLELQQQSFDVVVCHDASLHSSPVKHQFIAWLASRREASLASDANTSDSSDATADSGD